MSEITREEKRDTVSEKTEIGNPLYCACVDGLYIYKDPTTNNEFIWEEVTKQWKPKKVFGNSVNFDGQSYTYVDPQDGTTFEWDSQKSAWFPKSGEADGSTTSNRVGSENLSSETNISGEAESEGFLNPNYDNSLQSNQNQPRRFYYAALSPSEMGVNEPVLFLSPDDQVNNNSTAPEGRDLEQFDCTLSQSPTVAENYEKNLKSPNSSVPLGWERHEDSNGPYYWHIKSGTIQRELPNSDQSLSATSNPALLIPGSLNPTSFRRSQTISSQLSNSASNSTSFSSISNGLNNLSINALNNSILGNSYPVDNKDKRKSWSQFLENSERDKEQDKVRQNLLRQKERSDSSLRFVAVSLGCLNISEEDLTPERSSRAVSKVIAELTNPGHGIGGKCVSPSGMEVAGKIWGEGSELFLELDDSHLRVKTKDCSLTVAEQAIHSIRVWGVGRDDPRDFAYVAREKLTRQFLCHVFRLEMNARPLASALRDACKKIMIERQQKQKRPTSLPTGFRKTVNTSNPSANTLFPTPMDEPRKILKAHYLGSKIVSKPTGMEVLNSAIDSLRANEPVPVSVSVAPSVVTITSHEFDSPKLDEEFLVRYQLNYGVDPSSTDLSVSTASTSGIHELNNSQNIGNDECAGPSNPLKRKQPPQPPQWFELEDSQNTKVYVSNLPTDITEEEFVDVMQKYGLIVKDPQTGQSKIKLYSDANGKKKGDGLCTYIKIESVQLALQLLDESDLRGNKISVERARFELKGQYDPSKKPKQKKRKDKDKMKKKQESLFAWKPEKLRGQRGKNERVVVVQNAFTPEDFDKDVGLLLEYQQDFGEEAGKCGKCKKVVIFDRHPEGVMQIYMSSPEEADAVVMLFNNRFFGGKRISAFLWDGETKYKVEETDIEQEERLQKWEKFIAEPEGSADSGGAVEERETPPATPPYVGDEDESSD